MCLNWAPYFNLGVHVLVRFLFAREYRTKTKVQNQYYTLCEELY